MSFKVSTSTIFRTLLSCSSYFALAAYLYHNMSHQSSTNAAFRDSSVHSYRLLTPPLSPASSEDIPFKPEHGDHTSLSMKTRHRGQHHRRQRRLRNRACQSSHDLRLTLPTDEVAVHPLDHSKSLPTLKQTRAQPSPRIQSDSKRNSVGLIGPRSRRWTLPSKAPPTRGVASMTTVETKPARQKKQEPPDNLSPAMITLRRATTTRNESRKMSLTFFPEPTFERSRSGLLSSFLSTLTNVGNRSDPNDDADIVGKASSRRSSRTPSIEKGKAQPASCESAPIICTQVTGVVPSISVPGQKKSVSTPRRCSTKFVSGGSVFEVIWDEDMSSTTSDASSQPGLSPGGRRKSVAVDMLESQLVQAQAQSRRASQAIQLQIDGPASQGSRKSSDGSFQNLFSGKISGLFTDGARSRSWQASKSRTTSGISAVPKDVPCTQYDQPTETAQMDFFPPLRGGASATGSKKASVDDTDRVHFQPDSNVARRHPPLGSMVGCSRHRRRSTAPDTWAQRVRSNAVLSSRRASANIEPIKRTTVEDEITPLLSSVGMLE